VRDVAVARNSTLTGSVIPSVIFGIWGPLTFGPFLAHHVYPVLARLPNFPPFSIFRGNVGVGQGLLTSGLVLAVMIVPNIAATTRDLLRQVPEPTKEGATALGMTDAEGFRAVQLRWVRSGVLAAPCGPSSTSRRATASSWRTMRPCCS
jgi:phosphate transport system permease protein